MDRLTLIERLALTAALHQAPLVQSHVDLQGRRRGQKVTRVSDPKSAAMVL